MSADGEKPPRSQPSVPSDDGWLLPFLPQLHRRGSRLVEAGCGPGLDAKTLSEYGFQVIAFDRVRLGDARHRAPGVQFLRADLRQTLPLRSESFDAAVASLSLHYFSWEQTKRAFEEIRRALRPRTPFVFRVNATDDVHHSAGSGEAIAPNYYRAAPGSRPAANRFFDDEAIRAAVSHLFLLEHVEHRTIHRYKQAKQVWECLATVT